MAKISKLKFFISSSMGETVPIELRTVLKTLSDRYELFEFFFIEDTATPASLGPQMQRMIRQADAVVMIFHKLTPTAARAARAAGGVSGPGVGLVKGGVLFELQYALELGKPIFLFTERKFHDHPPSARYLREVWSEARVSSAVFETTQQCAEVIEQSLFSYIVAATQDQLAQDGQKKLSSTAGGGSGSGTSG